MWNKISKHWHDIKVNGIYNLLSIYLFDNGILNIIFIINWRTDRYQILMARQMKWSKEYR